MSVSLGTALEQNTVLPTGGGDRKSVRVRGLSRFPRVYLTLERGLEPILTKASCGPASISKPDWP